MDHKAALQTMAAERYLLNEFTPDEKEVFEEHLFGCDACAEDVKAGLLLMEASRKVLAFAPAPRAAAPAPRKRQWYEWVRPAFAIPAMALLLGVVVFQNLVVVPELHHSLMEMDAPEILPSAYLAGGSTRGGDHVVVAKPGELFQVTIDIPDSSSAGDTAELYDSAGQKKFSLAIPPETPKEGLELKMPGDLPSGSYSLVVKAAGTESSEIGRYPFTLRRS